MEKVDILTEKRIDLIHTDVGGKIYCMLFSKKHTINEISLKLYPHIYDLKATKQYKKRPHSAVSRYIGAFNILGWLKSEKSDFDLRKTLYKATLKPYFEFIQDKKLSNVQKKKIEEILEKYQSLFIKYVDFFDSVEMIIRNDIQRYFYLKFKEIEKLQLKEDHEFAIYASLAKKYLDTFTLELMVEYILLKLESNKKTKNMKYTIETLYWIFHHDLGFERVMIELPKDLKKKVNNNSKIM